MEWAGEWSDVQVGERWWGGASKQWGEQAVGQTRGTDANLLLAKPRHSTRVVIVPVQTEWPAREGAECRWQ